MKKGRLIGIVIGMLFLISVIVVKQFNFGGAGEYVVDTKGKVVSTKAYSYIGWFTDTGFAYAEWDEEDETLCGYINKQGKLIGGKKYKIGEIYNQTCDGQEYFIALNGEKAEIYDLEGILTGTMNKPIHFLNFQRCGIASLRDSESGLVGCVDKTGKFVIEPEYDARILFDTNGIAVTDDVDGNDVCLSLDGEKNFVLYDAWTKGFGGEQCQ